NVIETLDDVAVEGRNAAAAGIADFMKHLDGNDRGIRRNATGAGQNAGAPGGDAGHMRAVPAREVIVRARRTRARTGALRRPAGAVRAAGSARGETRFRHHLAAEEWVRAVHTGIDDRNGLPRPARAFGPCPVGTRNSGRLEQYRVI